MIKNYYSYFNSAKKKGYVGVAVYTKEKPSKEEYKVIVKISGMGIAIIGTLGFLIYLLWILIKPWQKYTH